MSPQRFGIEALTHFPGEHSDLSLYTDFRDGLGSARQRARPDGTVLPRSQEPPGAIEAPIGALRSRNRRLGLRVSAGTDARRWDVEHKDAVCLLNLWQQAGPRSRMLDKAKPFL